MGLQAIRGVHGATDNKPQAAARSQYIRGSAEVSREILTKSNCDIDLWFFKSRKGRHQGPQNTCLEICAIQGIKSMISL